MSNLTNPTNLPGFRGVVLKNPISGKVEVDFPDSLRTPRRQLSLFFTGACVLILVTVMTSIFIYKVRCHFVPSFLCFIYLLLFIIFLKASNSDFFVLLQENNK